jgi:hypothetical protein
MGALHLPKDATPGGRTQRYSWPAMPGPGNEIGPTTAGNIGCDRTVIERPARSLIGLAV